jgi:hypothetical protein
VKCAFAQNMLSQLSPTLHSKSSWLGSALLAPLCPYLGLFLFEDGTVQSFNVILLIGPLLLFYGPKGI